MINDVILILLESPLSLQSQCRLQLRKQFSFQQLDQLKEMEVISPQICDFLQFKEMALSISQIPDPETNSKVVLNLVRVLREIHSDGPIVRTKKFIEVKRENQDLDVFVSPDPVPEPQPVVFQGNAPPPPPPPPTPPRPGFWRFPEAEFADKGSGQNKK